MRRFLACSRLVLLGAASCMVGLATPADARITRIEVEVTQSPTFEGMSFGSVGTYERLVGKVFGEVDPADPLNALITDIELAPKNARGMVEYSANVLIIRPVDPAKGNHKLLYEVNNRGLIQGLGHFNDAAENNSDPQTAADAGNGFMMRQGYTLVWSGWDSVTPANPAFGGGPFVLDVPIAKNPDGSDIVGPSLEEFVINDDKTGRGLLTYPPADMDTSKAVLTVRANVDDAPTALRADEWKYDDDGTAVTLLPAGTKFKEGMLYELVYPAKNPKVTGLGFAAVRDVTAFLRHAEKDDQGNANPLAGDVSNVYTSCSSQSCRFMRDFVALGFNEVEGSQDQPSDRRKAIDGVLNWVGGASGIYLNYRFAQPYRSHRQHIGRHYPEFKFPFAYPTMTDPVSGRTDGLLTRCLETDNCPKIIDANSDNEYWAKNGALAHTDTAGNDLPETPGVRIFLVSSLPHFHGVPPSGKFICQQTVNPLVGNPAMRALLVALDQWVAEGVEPPASLVPKTSDGTLVGSAQADSGFPSIPGVNYSGRMHAGDLFDFGPQEADGILTVLPPKLVGTPYPALVPKSDVDGNTIAGLRLPDIAVPIATYTGWNLRVNPPQEGCDHAGMYIPFAATRVERMAGGDPRLSLEERYPDHAAYVAAVAKVARDLNSQRLLLEEDVERYIAAAESSAVGE